MRILLADPDRDLLSAYTKALALYGHDTTTAFDGTQLIGLLEEHAFDLAAVREQLPRISPQQVSALLRQREIPLILLLHRPLSGRLLPELPAAGDYLPFPFTPAELADRAEQVFRMARSGRLLTRGGLTVDESRFCVQGTDVTLCRGEIETLDKLFASRPVCAEDMPYLTSLTVKLARLSCGAEIRYTAEKGYQLVSVHA